MTDFKKDLLGGGLVTARLSVTVTSQSIANNTSTIRRILRIETGSFQSSPIFRDGSFTVRTSKQSGDARSGTHSLTLEPNKSYVISDTSVTLSHDALGKLSLAIDTDISWGTITGTSSATITGSMTVPAHNRVSVPTVSSSSVNAGSSVTINTNRKSTDLTHVVAYKFGSASGTISSSAGASVSWTPPLSLLSQIPNATSGTVTITVTTKDGSTTIGSKTVSFTLKAPTSVVPSVSSITVVDTVPNVASIVGRYVQGLSKPKATVASAGIYGSTIKESVYSLDGQVLASGATAKTLTKSGTLTVSAHVTDSRGRKSASETTTISVLPYEPPVFQAFDVSRALPDGTADLEGTNFLLVMDGKAQSLVNGSERNQLVVTVYTRLRGATAWTTRDSFTHSALRYNTPRVIEGTYPIDESYEVRVVIADRFNQAAAQTTVPTAMILMHWDGSNGVGIGKYRERGMLDIGGEAFAESFNGAVYASPIPNVIADLNDCVKSGFYQAASESILNRPAESAGVGSLEIEVLTLASGSVFQTARSHGPNGDPYRWEWVRDLRGTAGWSSWRIVHSPRVPFVPQIQSGITLGNGSMSGYWQISGGRAKIDIQLTAGSTTEVTGDVIFKAPIYLPSTLQHTGGGRISSANYNLATLSTNNLLYVRGMRAYSSTTAAIIQVALSDSNMLQAGRSLQAYFDVSL